MSPALYVWLRAVTQEPNWLSRMSLPLLENKIKNRECVPLPNVTQAGGKGSRLLAQCSREKCSIRLAGQDAVGGGGGARPLSSSCPRRPPQHWQKYTVKMRRQDHPWLKGSVLLQLERFPHLLGKYRGFYEKKTIIIFK